MSRWRATSLILLITLFLVTGCWDRTEINDLAMVLGWGMDITKDGTYVATAQFIIPIQASSGGRGGGGGDGNAFFAETATGKSISDASQNMQAKLSRKLFAGHRRDIFIGEDLAKHGVSDVMDEYSRNPDVRLRTDVFVVKHDTAADILKTTEPLEAIPAIAALKIHEVVGGVGDVALANFLIDASEESGSPTLPVVQIVSGSSQSDRGQGNSKNANELAYAGRAIFNRDLKLVGYLDGDEAAQAMWVRGQLNFYTLSGFVRQGNGDVSLDLTKLSNKVRPVIQGNRIKISITLTGRGIIRENNTHLDLTQSKNIRVIENTLDRETEQRVKQVIAQAQQKYKTDIFGFGESIHERYPERWKSLKKDWEEEFSQADVSVKVKLNIQRVGLTGPSMHLKESEIQK